MSDITKHSPKHDKGWVGVDLDRTLATYTGMKTLLEIGEPIAPMVDRVKKMLEEGEDVRIFTARISLNPIMEDYKTGKFIWTSDIIDAIQEWTLEHVGKKLPVTCVKDFKMKVLYDDLARQVVANEGIVVGE